ncbi:unnamed protein product [Plutella xylostella]|uniref:(diamondback moth) hypothetical protein n=1 Tax=Plutella xylostella TaxID=51655 RepID=A0A8S4G5Z5_PLUXY|nr:unnamed protein product [Plutella xylostella]
MTSVTIRVQNEDFEEEQGAGHYLNGKMDKQLFEGIMGGSGRYRIPELPPAVASGTCPVLTKIVQRCREVGPAGRRPRSAVLASLQPSSRFATFGEAPPTTWRLVFLSEADTGMRGRHGVPARGAGGADDAQGAPRQPVGRARRRVRGQPLLSATLKMNLNWQRAIQR